MSREYKRNCGSACFYLPSKANQEAKLRKAQAGLRKSKCEAYEEYIYKKLTIGWTPSQIAGRLTMEEKGFSVSYETIYEFIYNYHLDWAKLLPRKHEPRWLRGMGKKHSKREMIPNRTSILSRPKHIGDKSEFGHFEGDSIVCSQSKESLNVMVERQTQHVSINRVLNRGAEASKKVMIDILGRFNAGSCHSITLDNGIEFKGHEGVKEALKIETYFCQPYHSWEKGLVEQVNGLIRRFLPKKTDLSKVADKEIKLIEYLLNSRPRKLLSWRTPAEVFSEKSGMKLVGDAIAT
ncbi:Mobile element protein [hydrothermal vent metagenome]|uniref:Mobile element protein n=1 Tax=hydrothermal vent metagenome TaxID=652676 RepID=A0A3B0VSX9_9ZZZZ